MKLSNSLIFLFGVASAANFSKCPAIEAHKNENAKGPKCDKNMCERRCKDGFVAQKPRKVICNKNDNGKFKWSADLGGCKSAEAVTTEKPDVTDGGDAGEAPSCKNIELKPGQVKSGITVAYKTNSSGTDVVSLTCPEGSLINGKKGAIKKKMMCKCGASGKCKWKNEKNKKINKVIYQKWKCVASETDNTDTDSGNTNGGEDTDGDDNGAGETDICPQCTDQQKAGLARHNELRALHGSPMMKMTVELNQAAQAYAEELAAKGQMAHATNLQELGQGENLAWAWSSSGANADYPWATQQWYNEINDPGYDFSNPGFSSGIGHFTQVVWVKSTELGMGHAATPDGSVFTVARYAPAGNFMGQFAENVPNLLN